MKKVITTFLIISLIAPFFIKTSSAQAPEGFMYQAELRNSKGRTLSNASVLLDIRILIHNNLDSIDEFEWKRNYDVMTDKYGMISVIVGDEGTAQDPPFSEIPWGSATLYLHVSVNDGSGWVSMGNPVMLMSVPYALYAKSAGNSSSGTYYYYDKDNDNYGDKTNPVWVPDDIDPPEGFIINGEDCNDLDAAINPSSEEIPEDGIDQNCDGVEIYLDKDDDGFTSDVDCDDLDPEINPGAEEICWDGIDNNCDGNLDEDCQLDCKAELINLFDCVDQYCGGLADLTCINNNCGSYLTTYNLCVDMACVINISGIIDETWTSDEKADFILSHCSIEDADGDGQSVVEGDCDDSEPTVYEGAPEICDDGIDQDCNGRDAVCGDNDGDGFASIANGGADCDDENDQIYPGAEEICDGFDNDCDGTIDNIGDRGDENAYYIDQDGDGWGSDANIIYSCVPVNGYVFGVSGDCDDTDPNVNPVAQEICGNGVDDDCNGLVDDGSDNIYYFDADQDGYGNPVETIYACTPPNGYVDNPNDCDDADETVHPGVTDICDNGIDDDCDGIVDNGDSYLFYRDADLDGYGDTNITILGCYPPEGYTDYAEDCDDTDASIYPGAPEICGDNIDNNCDGVVDDGCTTDSDGDGILDVNDNCPNVANPDQADINGNGIGDACDYASGSLKINEVDYDNVGTDLNEFVEIYNPSETSVSIEGWTLETSSSPGSQFSNKYTFAGTIGAYGFMVAQDDLNSGLDLNLYNGPGAIRLLDASGSIVDAVYYEGYIDPGGQEGNPTIGENGSGDYSIGRYPDGVDTDNNNSDFKVMILTPGAPNQIEGVMLTEVLPVEQDLLLSETGTITVYLNTFAGSGGVEINISTNSQNIAVPSSLTIPEGNNSGEVEITAVFEGSATVTFSLGANNLTAIVNFVE